MTNINKDLTREFIQSIGFKFDGAYWTNNLNSVNLSYIEGSKWNSSIPGNLAIKKPIEISKYNQLILALLESYNSVIRSIVSKYSRGLSLPNEAFVEMSNYLDTLFGFDKNIKFKFEISSPGVSIVPMNAYTYTLMSGIEKEYKVYYSIGFEEDVSYEKFSIHPNCLNRSYLLNVIANVTKANKNDINIISLHEVHEDGTESIYLGNGIKFEQNEVQKEVSKSSCTSESLGTDEAEAGNA